MKYEERGKQMWHVLEEDNDWFSVVPSPDDEPHATLILIDGDEKEGELAGWDCPCKPQVDWKDKIIIHNSFEEARKNKDNPFPNPPIKSL